MNQHQDKTAINTCLCTCPVWPKIVNSYSTYLWRKSSFSKKNIYICAYIFYLITCQESSFGGPWTKTLLQILPWYWTHSIPFNICTLFVLCLAVLHICFLLVSCGWLIRVDLVCSRSRVANGCSATHLIARFMGRTWDPPGADRTQMGPMLATWTLLSGSLLYMRKSVMFFISWLCMVIFQCKSLAYVFCSFIEKSSALFNCTLK